MEPNIYSMKIISKLKTWLFTEGLFQKQSNCSWDSFFGSLRDANCRHEEVFFKFYWLLTEKNCLLSFRNVNKMKQATKWRKSILLISLLLLKDSLEINSQGMKDLTEWWNAYLRNLLANLHLYPFTYRTMEDIKKY